MAEGKARTVRDAITTVIFKHGVEPATNPPTGWSELFMDNSGNFRLKRSDGSVGGILGGNNLFDAGQLDPATLHPGLEVSLAKLGVAAQGISTDKLQDLAVTALKLANQSINDSKIVASGISVIALAAIGEAHIQNAAITDAKVASLSVAKLLAGTATFTGDVTFQNSASMIFSGTGSVQMVGSGGLGVSVGLTSLAQLDVKSAGIGWEIRGGGFPSISPSGGTNPTMTAAIFNVTSEYRKNGSALALADLAGALSASSISGGHLPSNVFGNGIVTPTQGIEALAFNAAGGYSGIDGSFQSADGKTVEVKGGIIWAIYTP